VQKEIPWVDLDSFWECFWDLHCYGIGRDMFIIRHSLLGFGTESTLDGCMGHILGYWMVWTGVFYFVIAHKHSRSLNSSILNRVYICEVSFSASLLGWWWWRLLQGRGIAPLVRRGQSLHRHFINQPTEQSQIRPVFVHRNLIRSLLPRFSIPCNASLCTGIVSLNSSCCAFYRNSPLTSSS
jgi:hypothetical protein